MDTHMHSNDASFKGQLLFLGTVLLIVGAVIGLVIGLVWFVFF